MRTEWNLKHTFKHFSNFQTEILELKTNQNFNLKFNKSISNFLLELCLLPALAASPLFDIE